MQGPHNQLQLQLAHLHIRLGMSPCFLKSDHYTILYYAKSDPIQNLITVLDMNQLSFAVVFAIKFQLQIWLQIQLLIQLQLKFQLQLWIWLLLKIQRPKVAKPPLEPLSLNILKYLIECTCDCNTVWCSG